MEFNVGDGIIIREWDDMAEEFGFEFDGNIRTYPQFVKSMRFLCGQHGVITKVRDKKICTVKFDDEIANELSLSYFLSTDMFIHECPEEISVESEESLASFVLGGV